MRNFKRLCAALAVMIVALGLLMMPASAEVEDTPVVDTEPGGEVITPPVQEEPVEEPAEDENNTLVARMYEWVELYFDEILTAISVALMGGYSLYQKSKNGTLIQGISRVLKSQGGVESASNLVTEALKAVEAKQDQLNRYYEAYSKDEAQRSKVTAALLVEVMALVEVQHISTLNNANVPQSLKDLVTSKYARCLSVINDDAELKAAYDEMRGVLGIGGNPDDEVWDD